MPADSAGLSLRRACTVRGFDEGAPVLAQTFDAEVMESDDAYWLVEFFAPW
jgi:hypothetical protein